MNRINKRKYTPKQIRFCKEYLVDCNATAAAIRAGYSRKTAKEMGHENLTKPHIAELLKKAQDVLAKRSEISVDWIIRRLRKNHRLAMEKGDIGQSNRALELIGKHLGMFKSKPQETTAMTYHVVTGISGPPGSKLKEKHSLTLAP